MALNGRVTLQLSRKGFTVLVWNGPNSLVMQPFHTIHNIYSNIRGTSGSVKAVHSVKKKKKKVLDFFSEKSTRKEEAVKALLYNKKEETLNKCCPNEVQEHCTAPYQASACKPLRSSIEKLPLRVLQCKGDGD